jgi:hypothetical protein
VKTALRTEITFLGGGFDVVCTLLLCTGEKGFRQKKRMAVFSLPGERRVEPEDVLVDAEHIVKLETNDIERTIRPTTQDQRSVVWLVYGAHGVIAFKDVDHPRIEACTHGQSIRLRENLSESPIEREWTQHSQNLWLWDE